MPTGYTACIGDGATFEEFVWGCARAFGALIMMRDDPGDAPIPEFKPRTEYYEKSLAEAESKLRELQSMTIDQAREAARHDHEAATLARQERAAERNALRAKYLDMRAKVAAWKPPTPEHNGMKEFMLKQIDQSIDFDCNDRWDDAPALQDPETWLKEQIERVARTIAYDKQHIAEEISRTNARNAWVRALDASVSRPAKLRP